MRQPSGHPSPVTRHPRASRSGFTLVEVLITTSLMTLVAGVLMAALSGGFRVWQRALDYGTGEQASLIAFDSMRRDLENSRRFALVPFQGAYDQVEFASVGVAVPGSGDPAEIGRLAYFLDGRHSLLCRSFAPYRAVRRVGPTDHCHVILEGVRRLRFEYFGEPEKEQEPGWSQHWDAAEPPLAVKVSADVQEQGKRTATRSFIVYLNHDLKADDEKS